MTEAALNALRFPVGQFESPALITNEHLREWIQEIEQFPVTVKELTGHLDSAAKNWQYRPGGWTIKQVVHHCADSHLNSLIRFKWTLTEDHPTIKAYFEARWAELADSLDDDLTDSFQLLSGLHNKWVLLLRSLSPEQLERTFIHPEGNRVISLKENIGLYAWHCRHHLAHIRAALEAKGKFTAL